MKRSEMQSLVANVIRLYRLDNVEDMEAANRLLRVLEEEGMYPPDRFTQGHHISEWEPEDDADT